MNCRPARAKTTQLQTNQQTTQNRNKVAAVRAGVNGRCSGWSRLLVVCHKGRAVGQNKGCTLSDRAGTVLQALSQLLLILTRNYSPSQGCREWSTSLRIFLGKHKSPGSWDDRWGAKKEPKEQRSFMLAWGLATLTGGKDTRASTPTLVYRNTPPFGFT